MTDQARDIIADSPMRLDVLSTYAPNEVLVDCDRADLARAGEYLDLCGASLATMVGLDMTPMEGDYAVEYSYSLPAFDEFIRLLRNTDPAQRQRFGQLYLQYQGFNAFNDPTVQSQAAAAGYADVSRYIQSLLDRDAERLAIQEGHDAVRNGKHRPFEEFDREFRAKNGLPPRN